MGCVVLGQGGEQGETHLAHPAHKRLLLHLNALVLQQVRGLVEDLQTLGALERPVLTHHALVLKGVCQVGEVVSTRPTFVYSVCFNLQGSLLVRRRVLLLLLLVVWTMLALLLQRRSVRLQDDPVHGAVQ